MKNVRIFFKDGLKMSKSIDGLRKSTPVVVKEAPKTHKEIKITTYHSREKARNFPKKTIAGVSLAGVVLSFGFIPYASSSLQYYLGQEKPKEAITVAKEPEVSIPEEILKLDIKTVAPINILEEKAKEQNARIIQKILANKGKPGTYNEIYLAAQNKYGVPWQVLAAVHYVETGQSGNTNRSSSAGATGPMQFLPSTFDAYAQDGNGDGVKSIYDVNDAIFSAAKLLAANGAASGNVAAALYRYNHSTLYVYRVLGIAKGFGYNG